MPKNDMNAVIYKILRYLYRCMQEGKKPDIGEYSHDSELLDIPERYWEDHGRADRERVYQGRI